MKKIINNFTLNPKNDILSGLTVALALIPEAVAISFVAGIDPLVGLYGAFMMGLITGLIGGRPGMISGATGAMAVVMVHMIQQGNAVGLALEVPIENLGLQWLFITLLYVGAIQIVAGFLRLGKFVRLIPYPVMMGFVNGLAIVIFLSQLELFKEKVNGQMQWLPGGDMALMLGLVALTMGIMYALPKVTEKIPAALMQLSSSPVSRSSAGWTSIRYGLLYETVTGQRGLTISTAFLLAAIGLIELLMTLNLVDDLTDTRGSGNKESVATAANFTNGLFGGMGGCAMIGQSIINVKSGGRGRLSGIVAAMGLQASVLFGAPLIEQIPLASLVGVMFMVVVGTFAWKNATMIRARKRIQDDGTKVYEILGPLFFGAVHTFNSKFDVENDPDKIEIDFVESKVSDHSGIGALTNWVDKYADTGKSVTLKHLNPECKTLLLKANQGLDAIIETSIDDPRYHGVTDMMDVEV